MAHARVTDNLKTSSRLNNNKYSNYQSVLPPGGIAYMDLTAQ